MASVAVGTRSCSRPAGCATQIRGRSPLQMRHTASVRRTKRWITPRAGRTLKGADATSCALNRHGQVKAVGPASGGGIRFQPLRSAVEESIRPNLIPACCVSHGNTELRKALPQVPFLDRAGLPTCLQDLVSGEGTPALDEFSSCLDCVFWREGLLRDRLDTFSPVWQRPAQRVAGPCLASATFGIPVTIMSCHTASLPRTKATHRAWRGTSYSRLSSAVGIISDRRASVRRDASTSAVIRH